MTAYLYCASDLRAGDDVRGQADVAVVGAIDVAHQQIHLR